MIRRRFRSRIQKMYNIILKKYLSGKVRPRRVLTALVIVTVWLILLSISLKLSTAISEDLKPPQRLLHNEFSYFRRNRSLKHYLDNIDVLIEPSSLPCTSLEEVPLLVLVATTPSRVEYRQAIRKTWGPRFPTYFVLGLDGTRETRDDNQLVDNYVEAKQYDDMVVFDFRDRYRNLTIKTGLMLKWTLRRCPQALFLYKVDDDVLVNPWMLMMILNDNSDAKLIGHVNHNETLSRDPTSKSYVPRWVCTEDLIPEFVTGAGYLINGEFIQDILKAADRVPLHNLEDVYFTYHVAQKALRYKVTHEARMSPYRIQPSFFPFNYLHPACGYWTYASMHGFNPEEYVKFYSYIERYGDIYDQIKTDESICYFYKKFIQRFIIMRRWD